ncbi:TIR domain-containing protein [Herbaspirillum lusitanum]|uniref:TIR domain-containing protein n=1 Tax=Herbaspirillum lusitanum TaxID=213312 RepID=A0ABW9A9Q9_9BURK
MARKVFYSFHYVPDNWRVSQVRNIGAIEGNRPASDNDWETVTKGGEKAIEKWIADQMVGRSCIVVLIGSNTANRKWINHEIVKGWDAGKGVLGIHIHNLKGVDGKTSSKGANPFDFITHGPSGRKLSAIVTVYDPPGNVSTDVYDHIKKNIETWIEGAIAIRGKN